MMFNSRENRGWPKRIVEFVWPRRGFRNAWNYRMLRLSRLRVCPHRLSLGFAAGAFASFTPLIGLHFILGMVLALVLRGNVLASAVGTVVGNPVTFPFIWLATYQVGSRILGASPQAASGASATPADTAAAATAWYEVGPVFQEALWPMLVGAIPLGLLGAAASYALCYATLTRLRRQRPVRRATMQNLSA
jgi:uncharacterized protein (DUF2062 family)